MSFTPFRKKLKKGIETPKEEMDIVRRRLAEVERFAREKTKSASH
jgi:phage-related protein